MPKKLAAEWLHSCSGCEISLLNMGEWLLTLLAELELVHMPILMDSKYFGPTGEGEVLSIPEADIGLVSGGCANVEQRDILQLMRRQCKRLIGIGTCATHGGIPAMINTWGLNKGYREVFSTGTPEGAEVPDLDVPEPLDRVYALDEIVELDLLVPGCPPNPMVLREVLEKCLDNDNPTLPTKSVCDTCPTRREGKSEHKTVKRFLENVSCTPDTGVEEMRCLLEQGLMCMGPVTAAGCATGGAPSCIKARVPCRGCFGPARQGGHQMLDMMNALTSNGVDFKSIIDRKNLLRFSGAHGRLRKLG